MEFFGTGNFRPNIASQNSDSDDYFSPPLTSGSDSDILETIARKADFVEFLDDDSSTFAASDGDLDT